MIHLLLSSAPVALRTIYFKFDKKLNTNLSKVLSPVHSCSSLTRWSQPDAEFALRWPVQWPSHSAWMSPATVSIASVHALALETGRTLECSFLMQFLQKLWDFGISLSPHNEVQRPVNFLLNSVNFHGKYLHRQKNSAKVSGRSLWGKLSLTSPASMSSVSMTVTACFLHCSDSTQLILSILDIEKPEN